MGCACGFEVVVSYGRPVMVEMMFLDQPEKEDQETNPDKSRVLLAGD